jgi:hypothetical protein
MQGASLLWYVQIFSQCIMFSRVIVINLRSFIFYLKPSMILPRNCSCLSCRSAVLRSPVKLVPVHGVKVYEERTGTATLIPQVDTIWRCMVSFTLRRFNPRRKNTCFH